MGGLPVSDDVIVLGRVDFGESDRIVRFLGQHVGRIDVLARGARSSKRHFGPAIDLGCRLRAQWHRGRGALPSLQEVDDVRVPTVARQSWDRLALLNYGCEVVGVLAGEAPDPKHYGLLDHLLDLINDVHLLPSDALRIAFEAKALTFAGLAPTLTRCGRCGDALLARCRFDMAAGGGVHETCGQGDLLDAQALAQLETLRREPMRIASTHEVDGRVRWVLARFIEYQMGLPLRSRQSIDPLELT